MIRLRRFHLRASTFALPPSRFAPRRTSRARADKSRYGGQVAATARQACLRQSFGAKTITTVAALMIGGGQSLLACPVCFGADETSMIDGAKLGVLVMLAVLFVVQGGFVAFFLYLRRCAKRNADIELDAEWSELQRSPRTS